MVRAGFQSPEAGACVPVDKMGAAVKITDTPYQASAKMCRDPAGSGVGAASLIEHQTWEVTRLDLDLFCLIP